MRPLQARTLVEQLERTLDDQGIDHQSTIAEFGQVGACEARARGRRFSMTGHLRGLVLVRSMLSNQRPWGPNSKKPRADQRHLLSV